MPGDPGSSLREMGRQPKAARAGGRFPKEETEQPRALLPVLTVTLRQGRGEIGTKGAWGQGGKGEMGAEGRWEQRNDGEERRDGVEGRWARGKMGKGEMGRGEVGAEKGWGTKGKWGMESRWGRARVGSRAEIEGEERCSAEEMGKREDGGKGEGMRTRRDGGPGGSRLGPRRCPFSTSRARRGAGQSRPDSAARGSPFAAGLQPSACHACLASSGTYSPGLVPQRAAPGPARWREVWGHSQRGGFEQSPPDPVSLGDPGDVGAEPVWSQG